MVHTPGKNTFPTLLSGWHFPAGNNGGWPFAKCALPLPVYICLHKVLCTEEYDDILLSVQAAWWFLMLDTWKHLLWLIQLLSGTQKSPPLTELSFLSRTSVYTSPAVPPWFTVWTVLFAKYLHISGNWRMPHVTGYSAHSVIFNLSLCPQRPIWQTAFPPGSHLPGFSVRAWLLWLPLHRFNLLNLHLIYHRKLYLSTRNFIFNNIFLSLRCCSLRSQ